MAQHHPRGLATIDPLAAPLRHGTEVTTRVERQFGERREANWEALRPCMVLEATVGSRAWA